MGQSSEFPQYQFMPPKSYSTGRESGQPTVIVIHTTEGAEGATKAEDGAAYDQVRTDGTSAHFYIDSDSAVQCVYTYNRAHTAKATGNKIGIHLELCGKANQTAAQWADSVSDATIVRAAEVCAALLEEYPSIPVKRLTVSELRAGKKGFCGHNDISNAFGESDHTDPGSNFPWSRLFDLIQSEVPGMSETDYANAVWAQKSAEYEDEDNSGVRESRTKGDILHATHDNAIDGKEATQRVEGVVGEVKEDVETLKADVAQLKTDVAAILVAVTPPPPPE